MNRVEFEPTMPRLRGRHQLSIRPQLHSVLGANFTDLLKIKRVKLYSAPLSHV